MIPFDISAIQPRPWRILSKSFEAERIASTYLLHGKAGAGQWALAISLAALVNCEQPQRAGDDDPLLPCGDCSECHRIFGLNHESVFCIAPLPPHKKEDEGVELLNEVIAAKRDEPFRLVANAPNMNISIDLARQVRQRLARIADRGRTRVVIFYHMEKMRLSSADALLKMIEEPPANTIIVLTADRPERLPRTIQSRAQAIRLQPVDADIASQYLVERYELSTERALQAARIADGSIGRAIELVDTDEDSDSSQRAVWFMIFKALFLDEPAKAVSLVTDMTDGRSQVDAARMLELWQILLRDCAGFAVSGDEDAIVNIDYATDIRKLSSYFAEPRVAASMAREIKNALADLRRNTHIHGTLAALVLRMKRQTEALPAA